MSWQWQIPKLFGTKWEKQALVSWSEEQPLVNVYCVGTDANPHPLYLLGLLTPDPANLREGREYWTFNPEYVTGDGYKIPLHQKAQDYGSPTNASPTATLLEVDKVLDTWDARLSADPAQIRERFHLLCSECGLSKSYRSDNPFLKEAGRRLFDAGFYEITLEGLLQLEKQC